MRTMQQSIKVRQTEADGMAAGSSRTGTSVRAGIPVHWGLGADCVSLPTPSRESAPVGLDRAQEQDCDDEEENEGRTCITARRE